MKNKIHII